MDGHVALEIWGRWAASDRGELDWYSESTIQRMVEYGANGCGQLGPNRLEVDQFCETIDATIKRLPDGERKAVKRRYTYWEPPAVSAKACGMRRDEFLQAVDRAIDRVGRYLEEIS